MLKLDGQSFGNIFCATGSRGFWGEGYPFHEYWKHFGMDWSGTGFAGKTLTLRSREGNMPLEDDGVTPKEAFPRSVWTSFFNEGEMMNAVGLSNRGAAFYLRKGHYHDIKKPFFLSFMTLAEDASGREVELRDFCRLLLSYLPFRAPVALQINFGCPNSGHDLNEFYGEICKLVEMAKAMLRIPVVVNCNALMPTPVLIEVARIADALWIGNTIPWNATDKIDWSRYGDVSPVRSKLDPKGARKEEKIDGGLSSPVCLPFTLQKIKELRDSGVNTPIVGGNGVRTIHDVIDLSSAGCDAIFIGSIAVVRPRRMQKIVSLSYQIFN